MLSTGGLFAQAAQIATTAIGTYMACFATTDARVRRARAELDQLRAEGEKMDQKIAELETECYAAKRAREQDLARWSDGLAASFGTELEEVTDQLMDMVSKASRGEDVTADLYDVHGTLCMMMADMYAIGYDADADPYLM